MQLVAPSHDPRTHLPSLVRGSPGISGSPCSSITFVTGRASLFSEREVAREGTIVNGAGVRDVSRALFVLPLILFFFYQARETTCRFTPAITFARLRTGAGQAWGLIGSRAICRESSSRMRVPRNARCRRATSTTMEKKRNRPGQRTTVASASGSFRLLSRSSRGCSRNASLGGRARYIRSKPAMLTIQY